MNNQSSNNDKTYNGWTNYETWVANLWLTNDQVTYDYWLEAASECRQSATRATQVTSGIWTVEEAMKFTLADRLKREVEEGSPITDASLYQDLLQASLDEVDWQEIAQSLLSEDEP